MKRGIIALAIAGLLISSFPAIVFADPPDNPGLVSGFSSEQILVKFKPDVTLPEAAEIHRRVGGQVKETIFGIGVQVVTVPKGQAMAKAKAYSANPRVAYAEPDFVVEASGTPNDPGFPSQWGMVKVQAPQAWDVTTGSPSITIAILDTGVDLGHPDLAVKIISNKNFTTSATMADVHGHGTHVAGIAAAITNNAIGVAGLGCDATIMNVKVLGDTGSGTYSAVASGIVWAADNGAEIINLSVGGSLASPTLEDAVDYAWSKGVVVVAAAGNGGSTTPSYPAYYANCIAVAATDANDTRPSWSNYGDWVDVAAPGASIYSTLKLSGYGYKSGTSMASPHVAGLAALVFTTVSDENGDGKVNDEVRNRIQAACDNIGVSGIGYGRINAGRAVASAPVPPGAITGQVTDAEDGSAVPGAQVTDGIRTALTDAAGTYTVGDVPPGTYEVVASKEGYQTSSLTVTVLSATTALADFSLTKVLVPGVITGSVTDAKDGSPIVGAAVTDGTRTATTDASGTYIIADVPPGSYDVTASKSGYENSSLTVTVSEGTTAVSDFSLNHLIIPGSIAGSVTNSKDGSVVVGATVTDGTRTTTTDATGKYAIANVPAGTYQVTASKSGYASVTSTVAVVSGGTASTNFSLTPKTPAMWVEGIRFIKNGKNLFIEVRVVTASGGVTGAQVGLMLESSSAQVWNFSGTTDTAGLARFKLGKAPAGGYVATVTGLTCSGFTWDASKGVTAISYTLGRCNN